MNKKILDYINENICAIGMKQENELKRMLHEFNTISLRDYSKNDKMTIAQVTRFFRIYLINMKPPDIIRKYFDRLFSEIEIESEK